MDPRLTRAQARAIERRAVDVPENERRGNRKRKINDPDLTEGHKKKTYRMSNCANPPNFIVKNQVAPEKPLPRTRKSPERKIVLPRHVREMDSSMSILLDVRSDISHSKIKDYDTALETIIGIQSSVICKKFLSYHPEARKFIPITEHQEEIAKLKLESEKIIAKLKAEVTELKIKVDEIAKENLEQEKKSIDYAADRDYWKGRVVELEKKQPVKVLDSQSDALDCPDEIKTLSSQVSNLNQELIHPEKRGTPMAENKLIRASADTALGSYSRANSHRQQMCSNRIMAEGNNLKEMPEIRISLQGLGLPTSLTTNSESACSRNAAEMPNNEEMDVEDDITSSIRGSRIHPPVTLSSMSLDSQKKVESTLRKHYHYYLNVKQITEKLEGPILVELMNGRMPPEKDLFRNIINNQFSKYRAANGEGGLSYIELVNVHAKLALDNIFPQSSQYLAIANNLNSSWKEEILKLGIVEVKNSKGDTKFILDGFANYFVARWLAETLTTQEGWNKELSIFLIKDVLATYCTKSYDTDSRDSNNSYQEWKCHTFFKKGLCSLLNSIAGEQKENILDRHIDFTEVCYKTDITAIGSACAHDGFSHLFKLIFDVGNFSGSGVSHLLFANSFIFAAASKPSLPMVEFLLNEMGMSEMLKEPNEKLADLIHFFTEDSRYDSDENIIEKKKILQLLNSVNPNLKNISSRRKAWRKMMEREGPPLLGYKVHLSLLTELVELGADVHAVDDRLNTVLHFNAKNGKVFESLLDIIPDKDLKELVHVKGFRGDTPLMSVVREDTQITRQILEKLLRVGADINVVDSEGYSVIAVAIRKEKDTWLINLLLDLGACTAWRGTKHETLLHLAVAVGVRSAELVSLLLKSKIHPNCKDANGETPLHIGLKNRSISLKDFQLLKSRTNVPSTKAFVVLQLQYVISECTGYSTANLQDLLVSLKLDQKHYFQYKNKYGDSLLHIATICGNKAAVKLLVQQGLDINVRNARLQTPLHVSVDFDSNIIRSRLKFIKCPVNIEMAKCLIDNGADPGLKDDKDYTFLHRYSMVNTNTSALQFDDLIKYLFSKDSLSLFNIHGGPNGSTPLQTAVQLLDLKTETIISLISHGDVDIKVLDNHGDSVLSYAVRGRKGEMFLKKLVEMGLDWNHVNFKGQNLLYLATQARNCAAVGLLRKNGVNKI